MNKTRTNTPATKPTFRLSVLDLQDIVSALELKIEYYKEMQMSTFTEENTLCKVRAELNRKLEVFG